MKTSIVVIIGLFLLAMNVGAMQHSNEVLMPLNDSQVSDDDWSDDWGEEVESSWSYSGFVELALGERLQDDVLFVDNSSLSELRWHQGVDYGHDAFDVNLAFDLWWDQLLDETVFDWRELNVKFTAVGQTDWIVGRQIVTWGTGDLLFINDLFPKDWVSFFSGREDSYLKAPANAVRLSSYFKVFNVDLVITPTAEPDRFINGQRFSLFSPFTETQVGGFEVINPVNPTQPEFALRLFKNHNGHQFSLYGYHGIEKSPIGINQNAQFYFPQKNVWGASFQSSLGQGLYNIEIGHHVALDDRQGNNPWVPNNQWRALIGYQRELIKKMNFSAQYYIEHTENDDRLLAHTITPESAPESKFEFEQNRQIITSRLTYLTQQNKLTWSLFVFYSPTDKDGHWRGSVNYRHNDHIQLKLGARVFHGKHPDSFFGQFEDASSFFTRFRYQF